MVHYAHYEALLIYSFSHVSSEPLYLGFIVIDALWLPFGFYLWKCPRNLCLTLVCLPLCLWIAEFLNEPHAHGSSHFL